MQTTLNTIFISHVHYLSLELVYPVDIGLYRRHVAHVAAEKSQNCFTYNLSALHICIWFEFHMKGLNDNTLLAGVGGTTGSRPIGFVGTSLEFKNLIDLYIPGPKIYMQKSVPI